MIPSVTKRFGRWLIGLWLGLFLLLPILWLLRLSILNDANHHAITLVHYYELWQGFFCKILWRSFQLALASTVLSLCIAYPFCYLLANYRRPALLMVFVVIPFWTSSLIRIYALIALLKARGLINRWLLNWGIIHQPLDLLYNKLAVVVGLSYDLLPFMVLPIYACFEKFDWTLLSVASDLGASWGYRFRTIVLPLTLPAIKNGVLMVFFPAMTLFYIPNLLGGARSFLVGNYIESQFLLVNDWPGGAASSVVIILLMLVFARLLGGWKQT